MLRLKFTEELIEELRHERYHHPHPRVQRKMNVLYLKSQGIPHKEIKRLEQISENTLLGYLREYQEGGIERLKKINFRRQTSELEEHRNTLEAYFRENPVASAKEAAARIEELTGIKRSPRRVLVFMRKLGMELRKVGTITTKSNTQVNEEVKPHIVDAQTGKRAFFWLMPPTSF